MQRSAHMVAATLGILKAGCAYVPLDAGYPAGRLRFMLEDTGTPVVLADRELVPEVESLAGNAVIVCADDARAEAVSAVEDRLEADNAAYVMYTSGSTGTPKGIVVPHRAIVRLVRNTNYVELDERERIGQVSNISFDAATFELWGALLNGATLVGVRKETALDPASFASAIREKRISTMFLTTALFNQMAREVPDAFRTMRTLLTGGEAMDASAVRRVLAAGPPRGLLNVYGPTESTTFATWYCIGSVDDGSASVPIGGPISNTTLYVLDHNLELAPVGVPGELFIGGDGLALGYWNRPELNVEKFVPNPFAAGERLYRTGDLVRYRRDGAIEFLGRLDHQVKVRGFRIEPGEIDAALASHPGLKASVTLVREDAPGEKRVVTYCVAADGQAPSGTEVRQFLAQRLPEYMLPSHVMTIDRLPINENGKIDRALLPAPGHQRLDKSDGPVPPRSDLERTLVTIWADVLGVEDIGIEDNFFAIGGHSLMATQVASRIRETLGVEIPLRLLFEHQTIAELAGHLGVTGATGRQAAQVRPRVDRGAPVPASFSQRRLWFLDQLMPGNALYNVPAMVRLTGKLDVDALETALSTVVNRHESLRTTFQMEGAQPVQVAGPENGLPLARIDLSQIDRDRREGELERLASDEAKRPFDLEKGPLVRATLVQMEPASFALLLTMHHIVCDGWSIGVFIREAGAIYESLVRGEQVKLPALTVQYADYSVWQQEQAQASEEKLAWWKERLAGTLPALELPVDRPRPAQPSFRGAQFRTELPRELANALKGVAQDNGATLFMTLLSGFKALLARYSGQEDIIVGSPIAGRTSAELEPLIGFFVNTLVLRTDVSGDPSFRELLSRVRENTLGAYANQDVPFEMLVDAVAPERSRSRNPLFQAAFVLQNAPASPLDLSGLKVQVEESDSGTSKFDLTLVTQETEDGISVCFEFSTDLFDEGTIRRMAEHLETLLSGIAENPERPISELPLMSDVEQNRVVHEWNQTTAPFPADRCIQDLFLEQVRRAPDAIAIAFEGRQMTYAELNARANQMAAALRTIGVGPEWLAAIALPRSAEMIVAILGVLKAGGAWMPVAVDQPEDRIAFMLNDACPQVVISDRDARARLPRAAHRFHALDIDDAAVKNESEADAPHGAKPGSLAYVIYTSGSTGRPKGVMLEHRGACNLAFAQAKLFGVSAGTRMLQFAAPTFDAAVSEIFVTLLNGGTLVLARRDQLVGHDLAELLKDAEVEVVTLPPSILATLPQSELPKLRTLVTAGEACPAELASRWSAGRRMINAYGPTEATVCATAGELDGDGRVTIGRPIDNVRVYIADAKLRPLPPGVPGEVLIGGVGVARGYLQRPELTRERFVPDPFAFDDGARVYRTGDRARFLEDGRIEYLGRTDRQVKIRGFRIEPGEIEAALLQHGTVREAVVIDREDTPGHRRLVAYVSRRDGAEIRAAELRAALSATLPEYMLPSAIVVVPALPLTAHGKIDRAALHAPEMDGGRGDAPHAAPRTETERQLAEIWKQVLGLSQVGVNDSFFELGGDSILTIQVVTRAREAGLNISPRDLFDHQTIASLAAAAEKAPAVMWEQSVAPGPVPLTPIQKWFFEQKLTDAHHWNQSVLLKLADAPDLAAMEGAVNALIAHHDALRLRFEESADEWRQEIVAAADAVTVPVFDLSDVNAGARAARMEEIATGLQASFDLGAPPLMKAALFNLGDAGWRLLVTAHHLSVDGVSWRILLEDLHTAYEQLRRGGTVRLAAKTASVRQWAEGLMARANSPETTAEAEYWRSVTRRDAAHLPVDWSGTPVENTRDSCDTAAMRLSPEQTAQLLREVPKAYRSQINDALLTALARAVRTWTGQDSVLVNLESHGRDAVPDGPDLSRTVGWFTSAYPVCIELPKSGDLGESLKAVKEQLRRVPRNGSGYGLLRYLAGGEIARELAGAPEPEIGFNYLGQLDGSFAQATAFSMAGESRGQEHSPRGRRTNLLEFNGNVSEGQLHFTCVYSRSIHDRATVEQLLREFAKELGALIAHCAAPDAGGFTPSDFPLAQLDERKLGKLARLIAKPAQGKVAATV